MQKKTIISIFQFEREAKKCGFVVFFEDGKTEKQKQIQVGILKVDDDTPN